MSKEISQEIVVNKCMNCTTRYAECRSLESLLRGNNISNIRKDGKEFLCDHYIDKNIKREKPTKTEYEQQTLFME